MIRVFFFTILIGILVCSASPAGAHATDLPGNGFAASRYETLWTKSPFAVAAAETAQDSPDYSLVGIAQFDGVSYASLIDKQSGEHFLLTTDKPARGLTLSSVTKGKDASGTQAVLQKNGQPLTLKLETTALAPVAAANAPSGPTLGRSAAPGGGMSYNRYQNSGQAPPPVTTHRRIFVPPIPAQPPPQH